MGNSPREWVDGSVVRLDRQDPYLRLQSVTIYVRDLDHSLSFYLDQLGFQLIFDARVQPGRRFVTVAPPDGTANLTLVAPEPGSEQYKLIGRPAPITFVTEDVIAKYREWTKRVVGFQFARGSNPNAAPRKNSKLPNRSRPGSSRRLCLRSRRLNMRAFAFRLARLVAIITTSWISAASASVSSSATSLEKESPPLS